MTSAEWKSKLINKFHSSNDVINLDFTIANRQGVISFIDGMTERTLLLESIVKPLSAVRESEEKSVTEDQIKNALINVCPIAVETEIELVNAVAAGDIALIVDGVDKMFMLSLRKYNTRSIAEPPTSSVLRGPREGFIEDIKINMTMLRRRLRTPDLVFINTTVGRYTQTTVSIVYIEGIANKKIVDNIVKRIDAIDIDGIVDSSAISRFIEERPHSLFKEVGNIEKPDILASKMLEGRVGIMVDGSPIVLTVPHILLESFQDSSDYFKKDTRATFCRMLRLLGEFIAVLLPAMYVAIQEYQYQMIPLKFMLTIINVTYGIPLSPTTEMICVLLIFEILNEASIRMPRYVGMALSIVGAIVLGDTAVNAGLISPPAVLVVALSAIGLYCVPDESGSFGMLRILFVILAGVLGLFGIVLGIALVLAYLGDVNSYGSPILAPFAPFIKDDIKDTFVKANNLDMTKRPASIQNSGNITRQKERGNDER